jgi:hypothetical protein
VMDHLQLPLDRFTVAARVDVESERDLATHRRPRWAGIDPTSAGELLGGRTALVTGRRCPEQSRARRRLLVRAGRDDERRCCA